jgi:SpoVK/Ycf46/Vps4 family AAA+-type ATPase
MNTNVAEANRLYNVVRLPDKSLDEAWDRIFLPDGVKTRFGRYLHHLTRLSASRISVATLATRRGLLLYGPPGCGKTSLAHGAANHFAISEGRDSLLVRVDGHALPSAERGGTQKNIQGLVKQLGELAGTGLRTFVLLDEVETVGTDRASISGATNPLDTIYGVNAMLEGLDSLVGSHPNLVFLFTTNMPRALDRALYERVDFRMYLGLPDAACRRRILDDAWSELVHVGLVPPATASDNAVWEDLVRASDGLSGRRLRHLIIQALAETDNIADLRPAHLLEAARLQAAQEHDLEEAGGVYTHGYQDRP